MARDESDVPGSNIPDRNPDPITGAPGSHPTGTAIGAAAGGATGIGAAMAVGAATGSVAGPIGTAIGIIAGAVVGGLAGKAIGEKNDPTEDESYWREEHRNRPYYNAAHDYDRDVAPAYRYGSTLGTQVNDTYPADDYRDANRVATADPVAPATTAGITSATGTPNTSADGRSTTEKVKDGARDVGHKVAEAGRDLKEKVKDTFNSDDDRAVGQRSYATHEGDIRTGWDKVRGESQLSYDEAQSAIRDAYNRRVASSRTAVNSGGTTPPSTSSTNASDI